MTTHIKYNSAQLNELLNLKEQEWRYAIQEHIDTLAKELAEKDELLTLEKLRFHKLKEDFEYNLKLVEDRDKDLKKYEQLFEQMKGNDNLKNHQVSEMKIKIDEFQTKFNLLQKEKEEMQHHYQMRLKHYQEEMTKFYAKKEEEHEKERDGYEELKRKLQRKIRDTEEELEFEKQKMLKELEESVRQKEQEFQIKIDQHETDIHAYELKVKMLSRELEIIQNSNMEAVENLESNKENANQFARLLKEKEWELQDMMSMKELRIKELEGQLDEMQKSTKWKAEEFERKYCELEKLSNERESNLANLKTAAANSELKLGEDLKLVHQQKEEMELNYKRLQWQISDMKVANEKEVQSYVQKVNQLEGNLKEEINGMNKEIVAKNVQVEALKLSEDFLRKESNKLTGDVDRLKRELSLAMDRERILEDAKVQLELDWRRRYETKETELYEKHDDLIKKLSAEKEESVHAKKQMEVELSRRENLIRLLEDDKAIAIKCLNKNGINTDTMFSDGIPERDIENIRTRDSQDDLQKKNTQLKEVIKEMRAEMELLSQQITSNTSTPNKMNNEEKTNYVRDLESELQKVKASNRNLMIKLEDLTKDNKPPLETDVKTKAKLCDPGVNSYVKELNGTIGALRNEKVLMTASLNSKDATINHLNETISKLSNESQQQVVLIDNLKFDISSKSRAFSQTISSLKNRVSELELHLQQARSEAEIYYKSVMERNSDATQANNKLSELKLQQSSHTNLPSHYGVVQDTKGSSFYKEKLKLAVERIKELAIERTQLINVGNKLRAELAKLKDNSPTVETCNEENLKSSNIRHYGNRIQSKLEKLEQMNYEATTNELRKEPKQKMDVNIKLMTSSTDISEIIDDWNNNDEPPTRESGKENLSPSQLRSSSEHSSINEIWKMLENADDISSIPDKDDDLALVGKQIQPDARKPVSKSPKLKQKKLGKVNKRPVVRNYNKKDDS